MIRSGYVLLMSIFRHFYSFFFLKWNRIIGDSRVGQDNRRSQIALQSKFKSSFFFFNLTNVVECTVCCCCFFCFFLQFFSFFCLGLALESLNPPPPPYPPKKKTKKQTLLPGLVLPSPVSPCFKSQSAGRPSVSRYEHTCTH